MGLIQSQTACSAGTLATTLKKNMSESVFIKIFDYFFDNTKKISAKLFIIFSIITSLWLIDNLFYFSKNGHYNYKLKQVKEINEILKDSVLFSNFEKQELIQIRKNILKEKYIFDLDNYYAKFETKIIKNEVNNTQIKVNKIEKNEFKELKNSFWYILFSIFFPAALLLIFIANFFEKLTDKQKRKDLDFKNYLLAFPVMFLFLSLSYLFYHLGQITPIFFESQLWVNYIFILYAPILMLLVIGLIANQVERIIDRFKKRKETDK